MSTLRIVSCAVPLIILSCLFFAYLAYVSYSLHIFTAPPPHPQVDCEKWDDRNNTEMQAYMTNRTVIYTNASASDKCWAIRKRRYLPLDVPNSMEVHHYLIIIKFVSRDYYFLEEVMTMLYSPLHFYCYVISNNTTELFERRVRTLGACIPNIIVVPGTFDQNDQEDVFRGYNACFKDMEEYDWKHTIITQEFDVPIQSIHYIADRARALDNGSLLGDIIYSTADLHTLQQNGPVGLNKLGKLKYAICEWNSARHHPLVVSRKLKPILFNTVANMTEQDLNFCQRKDKETELLNKSSNSSKCRTNILDEHNNCILGMEDYRTVLDSSSLFVRAEPRFDFGFVECVHQFVFTRTYQSHGDNIKYGF